MAEVAEDLPLLLEARPGARRGRIERQDLQGDGSPGILLMGEVDLSHAPHVEQALDAIATDLPPHQPAGNAAGRIVGNPLEDLLHAAGIEEFRAGGVGRQELLDLATEVGIARADPLEMRVALVIGQVEDGLEDLLHPSPA